MKRVMHIHLEDPIHEGGNVTVSAVLDGAGLPTRRIWYRVEEQHAEKLSQTGDHFLLGSLYPAMEDPSDIHVHGPVSSTLLRNLDEFQRAWRMWAPDMFCPAEISVDQELADTAAPRRGDAGDAILGFSGGVDSCFTAFRHIKGVAVPYPRRLKAGIMVHGFDIPLDQPDVFDRAAGKSRELLDSLNLELITVTTNLREHLANWSFATAAALASALMLFQGRFGQGLLAQGFGFGPTPNYVNGLSPAIDPLLSSGPMEIISDASGYSRAEKILTMKDWPEFNRLLRVCWRGAQLDRNCCDCEKCIRTLLMFRALGLGLPACFPHDVSDERIARMNAIKEIQISYAYGPILESAHAAGLGNESWVRTLERAIAKSRRIRRSKTYEFFDYYKRRIAREIRERLGLS